MRHTKSYLAIGISLVLAAVVLPILTTTALAQEPDYTLDWWTVDGGGGRWASAEEQYALYGTVGQPDARVWSDGKYTLVGGFWGGAAAEVVEHEVYLPLVLRQFP